jgi:hypothetical protein
LFGLGHLFRGLGNGGVQGCQTIGDAVEASESFLETGKGNGQSLETPFQAVHILNRRYRREAVDAFLENLDSTLDRCEPLKLLLQSTLHPLKALSRGVGGGERLEARGEGRNSLLEVELAVENISRRHVLRGWVAWGSYEY